MYYTTWCRGRKFAMNARNSWLLSDSGYDRIVGALSNPGNGISDQSVGNILRSHGIPPLQPTGQSWLESIPLPSRYSLGEERSPNTFCSPCLWRRPGE